MTRDCTKHCTRESYEHADRVSQTLGFRKYCLNSKRGQTFLDTVTARPTGNLETATELKLLI